MQVNDLSGQKFGYLEVMQRDGSTKNGQARWLCLCQCGKLKLITGVKLTAKKHPTRSCGCQKGNLISQALTTHGMTGTPTYESWGNMLNRCTNPSHERYRDYGGRGITVCLTWRTFEGFLEDMGVRPDGKELERRDNDKGYCKENCCWATPQQQANNRRSSRWIQTSKGRLTQAQVARIAGITPGAIQYRRKKGQSGDDLLKPRQCMTL